MKFRLVENFEGYKKGDKVELSNGQTGTVEADYNLHDDRIKVSIDGMDEIKFPLVDTIRPVRENTCTDNPLVEASEGKTTLEVKFEVYGRYGDGGEIITAKVSGKDLRHALMRMCDKMRLYIDSDDIERTNMTAEDILDSISEANGDGCDMIYMLRNLTTNEVLIDCSDCYEEQDWDDDFDESLKEKFNTASDFPYMFFYNCNNPTFGYDFQLFASSLGARKVYGKYNGNGAGSYFYLVPSEEVYDKLKAVAKDKYTVDMQKLLPYDAESYPNIQYMKESFSNNFESRELLDTGELISALRELVKEYGHMELEKEIYLETVENDHGRQLKIGFNVAESLTEAVKTPVVPEPYNKYLEIVPEEELDIEWHAKECSYDIAKEIAECAKRSLKLPAHEVEMLEHDINNLRSNEWVEQFSKLPIKSKARELFFKYAVERDEYGAGDKVSGATILGTLGPKTEYEDLFDSWYFLVDDPDFPVVEIVHDRLYPVELPELKEDIFQDLTKKINEMDKNAREYIYDRLNDYYMPYEPDEDKKKVTEIIFNKLKTSYREMFDFIPYWGREEEGADELWDQGVDENIIDLIAYENFPEPIISNIVSDQGYMNPDND